ncbi:T cell receptor alpha variable 16 [Camelus dromedarius]|nr:T cell receptor alpha variable 16 [Camelus dromedarius]
MPQLKLPCKDNPDSETPNRVRTYTTLEKADLVRLTVDENKSPACEVFRPNKIKKEDSSEGFVTSALSHLLRSLQRFQRSAMLLLLIPVLEMGFALRGAGAQSVTQPEDHVSVFARAPVQVKCNYSYPGSPVLFWYVQYPKQSLQLLLKHISKESVKGFTADLNTREASFHLKKPSAQEEDSAMYYCAVSDTVTGFTKEAEHKPLVIQRKYF